MHPAIKTTYIEILKRLTERPSRFHLRQGTKFCILGILCELYRLGTNEGHWKDDTFVINGKAYTECLPKRVQLWAGLDQQDTDTLYFLNDGDLFHQRRAYSARFIANHFVAPYL